MSPSGEKKSIGSFSCAPDFGPSAARAPFRVENRVRNREDPQPPNTNTLSFLHPQNTFKNDVTNLLGFFFFFFSLLPLSQIELCNSLFLPSVARLERVSIILSRGDGEFLEEAPEGGRVVGRVQKSVTKWSLIAWKTAPRSGHRSLVGVRPAGACVRCAPTSASRAGGAFWLPGRPGGLTSPPWSPRGALGLACPGRMPTQRREWGSEALLEFHQKSCLNPGVIFFLSFFLC